MAVLIALLAAALHASKDLVSKDLANKVDGTTSTFASFFFALPFYLVILLVLYFLGLESFSWQAKFFYFVLLRALSDACAEWLKMHALACGEISFISPFMALSPLLLLAAEPFISGDHVGALGLLGVLLSVAGSALLVIGNTHTPSDNPRRGIILGLGVSFFFALNTAFDKLAVSQASPVFSGFAMTALVCVLFVPTIIFNSKRVAALRINSKQFYLRGFFEVTFMIAKLTALQHLAAAYVSSLTRVSLLGSIIGGKVMFKDHDFKRRLLAGILIIAGTVLVIID